MSYQDKKKFFDQVLTLYGRKPVLEALNDSSIHHYKLHLSKSNRPNALLDSIITTAKNNTVDIAYHDKLALSRISKNGQQDQGVCLDILCPEWDQLNSYLSSTDISDDLRLIALDQITNPQNVGMIIRSACAGTIDGIILPDKGCAKLDALVVKASSGTLFKAKILRCKQLLDALKSSQRKGFDVVTLSAQGRMNYFSPAKPKPTIYVLGNESEGVSEAIQSLSDYTLSIPMNRKVESLNVAMAATLIAFREPNSAIDN